MVQDERLREDAKQLLRIAYERQVASGDVGLGVDLQEAAEQQGMGYESRYLAALVDYMEVAGWIEQDPGADPIGRGEVGMPVRKITGRGTEVLREAIASQGFPIRKRASLCGITTCRDG